MLRLCMVSLHGLYVWHLCHGELASQLWPNLGNPGERMSTKLESGKH